MTQGGQMRTIEVSGLEIRVRVRHGSLPGGERVESSAQSDEIFQVGFSVGYPRAGSGNPGSRVFNYAAAVREVRGWEPIDLSNPIEALADQVLQVIQDSAAQQEIGLQQVEVTVLRPRLAGLDIRASVRWRAPG